MLAQVLDESQGVLSDGGAAQAPARPITSVVFESSADVVNILDSNSW
jgi:hypothetical protein